MPYTCHKYCLARLTHWPAKVPSGVDRTLPVLFVTNWSTFDTLWVTVVMENFCAFVQLQPYSCNWTLFKVEPPGTSTHW